MWVYSRRAAFLRICAKLAGPGGKLAPMAKTIGALMMSSAVLALWCTTAQAHISLTSPAQRTPDQQKDGPCGAPGSTRGSNVTVYRPGETIKVEWTETIDHPGHYRIAFDADGQRFLMPLGNVDANQQYVLLDNIPDTNPPQGKYSAMVTLPNVQTENGTLQLIQVMSTAPVWTEPDLYFRCADIALRTGGAPTPDANTGGTDASNNATPDANTGGVTGGNVTGGGCQAAPRNAAGFFVLAVGLALGARRRRR